jgi:transketolase
MRGVILDAVFEKMKTDRNIFFLTADMGINLVERFQATFPDRYANVGIAEQNLVSISAGLANIGFRPFCYTISNFLVHRCFEQIRNDICLHNYPITLIGTSTGFDNSPLGPTHHVIDDWGLIKSLQIMDVFCPSSVSFALRIVDQVLINQRPTYIRIPKGSPQEPSSDSGVTIIHGSSNHTLLISYGTPVQYCLRALKQNPDLSLAVFNQLHPLDEMQILSVVGNYKRLMVVEDHFPHSGLYGSICELLTRHQISIPILSAAPTAHSFEVGTSPEFFSRKFGFGADSLLRQFSRL